MVILAFNFDSRAVMTFVNCFRLLCLGAMFKHIHDWTFSTFGIEKRHKHIFQGVPAVGFLGVVGVDKKVQRKPSLLFRFLIGVNVLYPSALEPNFGVAVGVRFL